MLLTLLLSFDGSRTTPPDAAVPGRGRDDRRDVVCSSKRDGHGAGS
jgi:hypothetical protein